MCGMVPIISERKSDNAMASSEGQTPCACVPGNLVKAGSCSVSNKFSYQNSEQGHFPLQALN